MKDPLLEKLVVIFTGVWGAFLIPSAGLIVFATQGMLNIPTHNAPLNSILYYNILFFPLLLMLSIALSWTFLKYNKYWLTFISMMLPFISIFVEIIVADIALFMA